MIDTMTPEGLWYVMNHLRAHDMREARASLIVHNDVPTACERMWHAPGQKFECRTQDGVPSVIGGFSPIWPGLCAGWLWGTYNWPKVALEVTKFVKHAILPGLEAAGFHRVECRTLKGNTETERWLRLLGFQEEAVTAQFGQGREDFILFARTAPRGDTPQVH